MTQLPELERKCFYCDGFGTVEIKVPTAPDVVTTEIDDCAECNGVGFNLTDDGETLVQFFKRWAKTDSTQD